MATPGSIIVRNGAGQSAPINSAFPSRVQVQAYDTGGSPMTGVALVYSVPQTGASGTFQSTGSGAFTVVTGLVGYADSDIITANGIGGSWTGLVQFVSAPGISASWSLTNTAPVPYAIAVQSGGDQRIPINTQSAAITVLVTDSAGAPMQNVGVRFDASSAYGSWQGTANSGIVDRFTNGSGIASANWNANGAVGTNNITIFIPGYSPSTTTTLTNVNPNVPVKVQVEGGNNQQANINTDFGAILICRIYNEFNQYTGMGALTGRFSAPQSGAACLFYSTNWWFDASADANGGIVTNIPKANGTVGNYQVIFRLDAYPNISCAFNLTNGSPPPPVVTVRGMLWEA